MNYYFSLKVDEEIELVQPTMEMAEPLFNLIDSDRACLGRFLTFVDGTNTVADTLNFIKKMLTRYVNGTDCLFFIAKDRELIGTIDFHFVDLPNQKAEIGYWLHSSQYGQGIAAKCVKKLCGLGFEEMNLNKLSILANVKNHASIRVAEKCGFALVGTEREEILQYGQFRDMNKYSLLKSEYTNREG